MAKLKEIICIPVGTFQANCYLIKQEGHVLIIDPGARAIKIMEYICDEIVDGIILTHGHFDHIGAVDEIMKATGCKCYLHRNDQEIVKNKNLNSMNGISAKIYHEVFDLHEGINQIGIFSLEVFNTPGHTPGSCLIKIDNDLFSGDVLFYMSIGRVDLPLGSEREMRDSLRFIKTLDPSLTVYPGHGQSTTLEFELNQNPWL